MSPYGTISAQKQYVLCVDNLWLFLTIFSGVGSNLVRFLEVRQVRGSVFGEKLEVRQVRGSVFRSKLEGQQVRGSVFRGSEGSRFGIIRFDPTLNHAQMAQTKYRLPASGDFGNLAADLRFAGYQLQDSSLKLRHLISLSSTCPPSKIPLKIVNQCPIYLPV